MFRRVVILFLAMAVFISGQMGFAATSHPVDASQIIIAEPMSEKITNDKQVYVTVNITNLKVTDHPIIVSLLRVENRLPFVENLGSDLKVSVMKLSSNSVGALDRTVANNMTYNTSTPNYSEDYAKETQVINRFYELKDLILAHNYEIASINNKYRFDLIVGNNEEISKLSADVTEQFKKWQSLKASVVDLRKEFVQVQAQYSKFFEKYLVLDRISTPSYYKTIGKLTNGQYILRFLDETSQLIKEFEFTIVDREETIKLIDPLAPKTN
ncbi:MAG: hypothetical protein LCH34_08135 [Firmicutes bacterium]|nr:hypothetical protein [Bacillota bacterium]